MGGHAGQVQNPHRGFKHRFRGTQVTFPEGKTGQPDMDHEMPSVYGPSPAPSSVPQLVQTCWKSWLVIHNCPHVLLLPPSQYFPTPQSAQQLPASADKSIFNHLPAETPGCSHLYSQMQPLLHFPSLGHLFGNTSWRKVESSLESGNENHGVWTSFLPFMHSPDVQPAFPLWKQILLLYTSLHFTSEFYFFMCPLFDWLTSPSFPLFSDTLSLPLLRKNHSIF